MLCPVPLQPPVPPSAALIPTGNPSSAQCVAAPPKAPVCSLSDRGMDKPLIYLIFIARSVAGGARLESWPDTRGDVRIWGAKGEQAESMLLTMEPWKSAVPPELSFHLNNLHFLSFFFSL